MDRLWEYKVGNLKWFDLTWQYFGENALLSVPFPLQSMEIGKISVKGHDAAYMNFWKYHLIPSSDWITSHNFNFGRNSQSSFFNEEDPEI